MLTRRNSIRSAIPADFDGVAIPLAAIAIQLVAVVAFLARVFGPVAALFTLAAGHRTVEMSFDRGAGFVAAIARLAIAVVADFVALDASVTANATGFTGNQADPVIVDRR